MAASPEELQELAAEAERLLAPGSLFNRIVKTILADTMQELIQAPLYDLTAQAAHAKMRALESIKGQLQIVVNDAKMASRKGK